jgi:hypothetical protein
MTPDLDSSHAGGVACTPRYEMRVAMFRRLCSLILIVITLSSLCTDVLACGDKFLRVGRSPRFRNYASVHPSPILVFAPRWTRHGISEFEHMLTRAGHTPVTVTTADGLSQAFAARKYAVIITGYDDAVNVRQQLEAIPSSPALLPLLYKATKKAEAEASATYRCLLRPEKMTAFQALEEIDRLIDLRLKDAASAVAAR